MKQNFKLSIFILAIGLLTISCQNHQVQITGTKKTVPGYYHEQYRPQFHFSPESGWMNDPNGLVYYAGEYHLFYQYYPDSTVWGPMHWGHAVSSDLIGWKHLPVALSPDSLGYIFSGSAVVDVNNTTGFGTVEKPPMVAIFTYHNPILEKSGSNTFQNQGIAYSLDKGRTWTKYAGNPVLKNPGIRDFRDPKMFWNEDLKKWELILAVKDRVHIYSSSDMKSWVFESEFGKSIGAHGGVWECPDLFPINIVGTSVKKWVMLVSINPGGPNGGSATQYFTGNFDGHKFVPDETEVKWVDWGRDNYAGVTWSNIPEKDGRRIFIGWMSNWDYATVVPATTWRSASTIPRELILISDNGHYFLSSMPLREFGDLRIKSDSSIVRMQSFNGEKEIPTPKLSLMQCEMLFGFELTSSPADTVGIILSNDINEKLVIGYSKSHRQFFVDRRAAGRSDFSNNFNGIATADYDARPILKLHFFVDASSVEMFVDDGRVVMTNLVFPRKEYTHLKLFSKGGSGLLNKGIVVSLSGIWPSGK